RREPCGGRVRDGRRMARRSCLHESEAPWEPPVSAVASELNDRSSIEYRARMDDAVTELARVPLFSGLSKRQLKKLASSFRERTYGPGITIVREAQMSGVGFFVIVDGAAV